MVVDWRRRSAYDGEAEREWQWGWKRQGPRAGEGRRERARHEGGAAGDLLHGRPPAAQGQRVLHPRAQGITQDRRDDRASVLWPRTDPGPPRRRAVGLR